MHGCESTGGLLSNRGECMATDTLGIMITKNENIEHLTGIVKAARTAGKKVTIFVMDEGVRFMRDQQFLDLINVDGVQFTCCGHSCERAGIREIAEAIFYGSQCNNAGMLHDSYRIK